MQLAIILFAVVVAVSAHPGLIDPWASPVAAHGHAPISVHQQYVKVDQPAPIPELHPQPVHIKVPHTESVRLHLHPVKIHTPHLIGWEEAAPEPAIKHVHKSAHSW